MSFQQDPLILDPRAYTRAAIIQTAAIKNCAWWKQHIGQLAVLQTVKAKESHEAAKAYRKAVKEFKETAPWKDEFNSWEECTKTVLGISPQRANELIREYDEVYLTDGKPLSTFLPVTTTYDDKSQEHHKTTTPAIETKILTVQQPGDVPHGKPPSKLEKNGAPEPKKNGAPESAPVVDKTGRPIPPYAVEYWKRGTEVQHVLSALSDLRTTIRKANEGGDRLWCAFSTQDMLLSFDALYTSVSNFMPYAVCKKCNGLEGKTLCSMCHGTGLINKITYGFNKS